jgi:hypothetical protein
MLARGTGETEFKKPANFRACAVGLEKEALENSECDRNGLNFVTWGIIYTKIMREKAYSWNEYSLFHSIFHCF